MRKDYPDLAWAFSVKVAPSFDSGTVSNGDTIGDEGGSLKLRLRHCAKGVHGLQIETLTLFHPNSVLDQHETFGDHPRSPPPPGVDTCPSSDEGWLKKDLHLFGAARSGSRTATRLASARRPPGTLRPNLP